MELSSTVFLCWVGLDSLPESGIGHLEGRGVLPEVLVNLDVWLVHEFDSVLSLNQHVDVDDFLEWVEDTVDKDEAWDDNQES